MSIKNIWNKIKSFNNPVVVDSKQRVKDLILQKVKPKRESETAINAEESNWYHIRTRYKMACLFGMASKMPDGIVPLTDGSQISPSKDHSEESLRYAISLREHILKEYGIDLEDFIDEKS